MISLKKQTFFSEGEATERVIFTLKSKQSSWKVFNKNGKWKFTEEKEQKEEN